MNNLNKKVLIYDIEMSKGVYFSFPSHKPVKLQLRDKIQDQFMISVAWRWWGEEEINMVSILDHVTRFNRDYTDDYHVVKAIHQEIEKADILVGHNSDGFDTKHLQFLAYKHGLDPLPKLKSIDTLKQARRIFRNDSLSLDEIAKTRGLQTKVDVPNKNLVWNMATMGCPEAIATIAEYNIGDIEVQTDLLEDMLPWMISAPALYLDEGREDTAKTCEKCGEKHALQNRGFLYNNRRTTKYQRFKCLTCSSWGVDRSVNLLSKIYLKSKGETND